MKEEGRQNLLVDVIKISPELNQTQSLMPISKSDRERIFQSIKSDGIRDPIRVYQTKNGYFLLSGFNRLEIAKELGFKEIPAIIMNGKPDERLNFTIMENLNRRHFTTKQKQDLIIFFMKKYKDKSNNAIAKITGTDHKTVGKIRDELGISQSTNSGRKKNSISQQIESIEKKIKKLENQIIVERARLKALEEVNAKQNKNQTAERNRN